MLRIETIVAAAAKVQRTDLASEWMHRFNHLMRKAAPEHTFVTVSRFIGQQQNACVEQLRDEYSDAETRTILLLIGSFFAASCLIY